MSATQETLDQALDLLADLGMKALLSQVVEPVFGAVIDMGAAECSTQSGSERFLGDYWGLCESLAQAFEEPALAEKSAALFFSRAPALCSAWAGSEKVEGRDRLVMSDLKILMSAASVSSHELGAALAAAALARSREGLAGSAKGKGKHKGAGDPAGPAPEELGASPLAKLESDWSGSFLWPDYPPLNDVWAQTLDVAQTGGALGARELDRLLLAIEQRADKAGNSAVAVAYLGRLMSLAAKSERGLALPEGSWRRVANALVDRSALAREQAKTGKDPAQWAKDDGGLAEIGGKLLQRFGQMSGQISERLIEDLLLGALLRSQEGPEGERASTEMVAACKLVFVERAEELSVKSGERLANIAQAAANRVDLAGGAACLPLPAAQALYDGLCSRKPALPWEWTPGMNPSTLAWLQERSLTEDPGGAVEASGARFARLAARLVKAPIGSDRQAALGAWLEAAPLRLCPSPESLAAAEAAQALATSRLDSPLMGAINAKLQALGVAAPQLLEGFQALLLALGSFGAPAPAVGRAERAMAPALAALEAQQIEAALAAPEPGDEPAAARRSARL